MTAVEPYVAESWKFSNGNKTLTFKLQTRAEIPQRRPARRQRGQMVASNGPSTRESGGYSVFEETDFTPPLVKSIEAPDADDGGDQLQAPGAEPAAGPLDPDRRRDLRPESGRRKRRPETGRCPNEYLGTHSAGYGPYLLKSYQPNREIVLEANPDFFEPPKTKNVIIKFIPDNETLLLERAVGSGRRDAGDVGPGRQQPRRERLLHRRRTFKSRQAQTLNFPINEHEPFKSETMPFFKNDKFRQALSYAFPYEAVLQKIGYGYGELYNGEWMPAFSWYDPKVGAPSETNVDKAKELIGRIRASRPRSASPIYVSQGATVEKEIATAAAGAWEELGVNAKVQTTSPANFLEVVYTTHTGASVFVDGPQVVAPDYYWAYDLQCPPNNEFNDTDVCVKESDAAMKKVPYTTQEPQLKELLNKANEGWIEAAPRIWVYNQQTRRRARQENDRLLLQRPARSALVVEGK